jgi:transcriptional regulator with XRE-family HTH domain
MYRGKQGNGLLSCDSIIGSNIRKLRTTKGLPQEELAFRTGVDRPYLSEVENGYKNLSVNVLDQISAALEVDIEIIFEGYRRAVRRS